MGISAKVIVTPHAEDRISERGDSIVTVSTVVKEASSHILAAGVWSKNRRIALCSHRLNTIPVIEISPRRYGVGLVVITVLPRSSRIPHPVVTI